MKTINIGSNVTNLDFALMTADRELVMLSCYGRSRQILNSIACTVHRKEIKAYRRSRAVNELIDGSEPFDAFVTPVLDKKEKYYNGIFFSKNINKTIIITNPKDIEADFYNHLMRNYSLPLMRSWIPPLLVYLEQNEKIVSGFEIVEDEEIGRKIHPELNNISVLKLDLGEQDLKNALVELHKRSVIWISKEKQQSITVENIDDYYSKYSQSIISNLEKSLNPLTELNGNCDTVALKKMRLFPQQIAVVNGMEKLLHKKNYGILNGGMGVGKTIMTIAIAESFANSKYMRVHNTKNLFECYQPGNVGYRNIVMAPSHLVEKWASEIKNNVANSEVKILSKFSDILALKKKVGVDPTKREWYIVGKDFAKMSYESIPVVSESNKIGDYIYNKVCSSCGNIIPHGHFKCNECGNRSSKKIEYVPNKAEDKVKGLVCPNCGKVIVRYSKENGFSSLTPRDFASRKSDNEKCGYCGTSFWQVNANNLDSLFARKKPKKWYKATHYANKAHKAKKTVWVRRGNEIDYFTDHEQALSYKESKGSRKYSPATFFKKWMKNFFDIAIFDEMHLYKGGATAQGNAMHSIIKASKKQIGLTGTIAGGYANHLFYTLWRLDPHRMYSRGYSFSDELQFANDYGTVERTYDYTENDYISESNKNSRGKLLHSPKVKPGISPLIFTDFLLDCTTFIDITDMSSFLPPLHESIVSVEPEQDMLQEYNRVISSLKAESKSRDGGLGIISTMLQFSLSYPDHPYGRSSIINPKTGFIIDEPKNLSCYIEDGGMINKERQLVDLVKNELSENRNCVVYCEYTSSAETKVTDRLKKLLEVNLSLKDNEVVIIESSSPKAKDREAWMHKKAAEGAKIFITNPKNVETGLDFCWVEKGVKYNFPTLIFYQMGYSLFTLWQASRRAYRLNQKEECRTYYFSYDKTIQPAVIQLMAEKENATSLIQGHFSAEGLAAMAKGVDTRMRLVKALSDNDTKSANQLQQMFDVIGKVSGKDDMQMSDWTPMKTIDELFTINDTQYTEIEVIKSHEIHYENSLDTANISVFAKLMGQTKTAVITKKNKNKTVVGQLTFDF